MHSDRVLAIDIGGTKLAAALCTPDGEVEGPVYEDCRSEDGAERVLERALAIGRRCIDAAPGRAVGAVGLSTMGYTHDERVDLAPNVPGWGDLHIPAALAAAFPDLPAAIGNDVKVATRAEMAWGELVGVEHGVYLNLGTGIAAGLVVAGRLVGGAHDAAGEIGYSLPDDMPPERMAADGAAPLEERYGGAGMARRLSRLAGATVGVKDLDALAEHDEAMAAEREQLWSGIATATANLCIALDPDVVVVGGGYVRSGVRGVDAIRSVTARACPYPPDIRLARFGADAALVGAAAIAWADALGRAPAGSAGRATSSDHPTELQGRSPQP